MKLEKVKSTGREKYILDACRNQKVLHLGCADWPFTKDRIVKNKLLHESIQNVAAHLSGVDLSSEGIQIMKDSGYKNIHLANSESSLFEVVGEKYDVIIAGEIIEHVDNAGSFLSSIQSVMNEQSILLITTPNFASMKKIPRLLWNNETVHPDHVCYYSRSTLTKLLERHNYIVTDFAVSWWDSGLASRVANRVFSKIKMFNYLADTIIAKASKK